MKYQTNVTYRAGAWVCVMAFCVAGLLGGLVKAAPSPITLPSVPSLADAPEAWGGSPVNKPAPATAAPADCLIALPPATSLARLPMGRLQVGRGRIDPTEALSATDGAYIYVVRAQSPGIVEYLYPPDGLVQAGDPLTRLYDQTILSDLKIGESAMSRFATSPFVIAPRQRTLPPVPPRDFPKPTVMQRLLGIKPTPPPAPSAPVPQLISGLVNRLPRAGLLRNTSLAPKTVPEALQPPPKKPKPMASLKDISHLSQNLADLHSQRDTLDAKVAGVDADIAAAQATITQQKEDVTARERLYNEGVLARNSYEAARAKLASLEDNLARLQKHRQELNATRATMQQRYAAMKDAMAEKVASRAQPVPPPPTHVNKPQPVLAAPQVVAEVPAPPAPVAVDHSRAAAPPADTFPAPTRPARPELRALPRVPAPHHLPWRSTAEIPTVPPQVTRLAAPRWVDQSLPTDGLVLRQLVPAGSQVAAGTPLLEVVNSEWARVYADVDIESVGRFPNGAPVKISFDDYPGVALEGWVNSAQPLPGTGLARVEMVVFCRQGYYADDTYASLDWLELAAPIVSQDRPQAMAPAISRETALQAGQAEIYELFPIVPPELGPAQAPVDTISDNEYTGVMRLAEMDSERKAALKQDPAQAKRLAMLHKWRDSFTAGMTTTLFGNLLLTYPRNTEVGRAVEKMATGEVSHLPDLCAQTMREALGWGLGDAAMWMQRLPERGYRPRKDGLARPGDILVWPFTYGPNHSQHIGIAVSQSGKLMLLSNLGGNLGTSELLGGYIAFYKPGSEKTAQSLSGSLAK